MNVAGIVVDELYVANFPSSVETVVIKNENIVVITKNDKCLQQNKIQVEKADIAVIEFLNNYDRVMLTLKYDHREVSIISKYDTVILSNECTKPLEVVL